MLRIKSSLPAEVEAVVTEAVDVGFTVYSELGPGFKEVIYERAYCLELDARGIKYECEKQIEVKYKQWRIPGQKIDLIVAGVVLVELKAVPCLKKIHRRQVVSYLKTMDLQIGLLMNFNVTFFKTNIKRVIRSVENK
jgi:GxxExxY protein